MTIPLRARAFALFILVLGSSCSVEEACAPPYHRHEVYLYATPEQTYLFFKNEPRPIGYTITNDTEFWVEIRSVFSSHIGKDIGVKASVCGKVELVDLPLSPYVRSMSIREGTVLKPVDVTKLRENYQRQIGTPKPAVGYQPPGQNDR